MELSSSSVLYDILISDIVAAISGLFGGLSISFFWRPQKLNNHDKIIALLIIIIISISSAFSLVGIISEIIHININQIENAIGLGYLVGAISVGLITLLANFFSNREGNDILDVATELKQAAKSVRRRNAPPQKTLKDKDPPVH
ncbi:hypothetical protein BIY29_14535 [Brenneria alni]|uniref:Uncharacterized protein n=1 Tax=Brenneria alni TaxID=71656 RepID=A0A421DLH6_9GAMM|nr:hypothetical protein [Brenneria alni]RLM20984.1 hypothetical protein BIY29_14535 [Brenneria alni]